MLVGPSNRLKIISIGHADFMFYQVNRYTCLIEERDSFADPRYNAVPVSGFVMD